MMWGYGHMGDGGWGVFGLIFMALFWIAVIVAIVFVVRALARGGWGGGPYSAGPGARPESQRSSALQILEERYARGEIEREEFLRRKEDLRP